MRKRKRVKIKVKEYTERVYLQDECPRLGCGWRTLLIHEGHKWVHLTDSAGRRQRITFDLLDELLNTKHRR